MNQIKRRKFARRMGIISLTCPVLLGLLLFLMHQGAFSFRDDFHGLRSVGFFMTWILILLPIGAVLGSAGIFLHRTSLAAILGLALNTGLMLFAIVKL